MLKSDLYKIHNVFKLFEMKTRINIQTKHTYIMNYSMNQYQFLCVYKIYVFLTHL